MSDRPFDLETYMKGVPAITRAGKKVYFVALEPRARKHMQLISVDDSGGYIFSRKNGRFSCIDKDTEYDLVQMAPEIVEFWGRGYRCPDGQIRLMVDDKHYTLEAEPPANTKWIDRHPFLIGEYDK